MEWWWSCYGCSGVLTTEEQRRRCDPRSIGRGWMEVERSMYVLLSPRHGIPARRPGRELLRISLTSVYCRTAGSMRGVTRAEQQPKAPKAPPSNGTHTGPTSFIIQEAIPTVHAVIAHSNRPMCGGKCRSHPRQANTEPRC
jgi:hypothetical protein